MSTVNNDIPFVPENTTDPAAGLNLSLNVIDALLQIAVVAIQNTPPGSPTEGQRYIVGAAGTGDWAGQDNRLARYLDGGWSFYDARMAVNLSDGNLYVRNDSGWVSGGGCYIIAGGSGDGTTNDTAAAQASIDAAEAAVVSGVATVARILFRSGTYMVDPLYVGVSNIAIVLEPGATLKRRPATITNDDSIGVINFHGTSSSRISNVGIFGGTVDGNKANIAIGPGGDPLDVECVSFRYCDEPVVEYTKTINATADGIDFDYCKNGKVYSTHGHNCGGNAVHFSYECSGMTGVACTADLCGIDHMRNGFDVYSTATNCEYVACHTTDCYRGFRVDGDKNRISGGSATGSTINGVRVEGDGNIISNVITDGVSAGNGITVTGVRNIINGGQYLGASSSGVAIVSGGENNIVCGVVSTANAASGVYLTSGANNNIVTTNQLGGNTTGSILDSGSGNIVTPNIT